MHRLPVVTADVWKQEILDHLAVLMNVVLTFTAGSITIAIL